MSDPPALRIAPPPFMAEPAFGALLAALPEARVVGGAVRDALAGRPIADIDLAIGLTPDAVMAALRRAGIRAVPTGLDHGTVTAVLRGPKHGSGDGALGKRAVEITTLRRDVATDGRRATVAFTDDWRQDAARRDFTINAMSMTRDGWVHDYFGGVGDLRAGVLRFVGDPVRRIAEDFLRVLRYFRFFARYAARLPEAAVRDALRAGIPGLATLSAERVWSELRRILDAPDPGAAVALMAELGVLGAVIPEGADPGVLARLISVGAPADGLLRLAGLLTGDIEHFADRLRLSAAERQRLRDLRTTPLAGPRDDDAALRRLLADHDRAALIDRTWLGEVGLVAVGLGAGGPLVDGLGADGPGADGLDADADGRAVDRLVTDGLDADGPVSDGSDVDRGAPDRLTGARQPDWAALRVRLGELPKPVFPLQGSDVLALGVPPGPRVGALLRAVRGWWLEGGCTADVAACRAELARRLARRALQPPAVAPAPVTRPGRGRSDRSA